VREVAAGDGPYERLPLSFFAVEPQLAMGSDSLAPTLELCKLVDTLTAAGLSVICQVIPSLCQKPVC
jgi:hypothetical protein